MSTATLNVWITNLGNPFSIANDVGSGIPYAWSVNVFGCGGLLNWSEGRYRHHQEDKWIPIPEKAGPGEVKGHWYEDIPTRDGHVEIEVPPGSYLIVGSMHTWFVNGMLYGNWATDRAVVHACCGTDVCVTLFASSAQPCSVLLQAFVFPLLVQHEVLDKERGKRAIEALKGIFKPEQLSPFEEAQLDTFRRVFKQMK